MRKQKLDTDVQNQLTRITDFDAPLVQALATIGVLVHVPHGWAILTEMTPGDSAYVLLEGTVDIRKAGETRRTLGPGAVFGEIALVNHRLRSASVVASTDITALRLEASAVQALVDLNPGFAEALSDSATERLGSF